MKTLGVRKAREPVGEQGVTGGESRRTNGGAGGRREGCEDDLRRKKEGKTGRTPGEAMDDQEDEKDERSVGRTSGRRWEGTKMVLGGRKESWEGEERGNNNTTVHGAVAPPPHHYTLDHKYI